jgi:transglutaminase-like putative cysteine protease
MAVLHWVALVSPTQTGRGVLVALVATACGVAIAATAGVPRPAGGVIRILILVLALALALVAVGLRLKLLAPARWDTLGDRVSGGLAVVDSVTAWPYDGPNAWLRLTTLLAAPLIATPAAALAFWPSARPRRAAALRFTALALLLMLYGVAVAARPFDQQGLRGVGLMAAIAAWLWLPRLRGRTAVAAVVAVAAASLLGVGLTAKVASHEPWVDYRKWSWAVRKEKAITFDWRHGYGPLKWPRKGTTLMLIKSKQPHYWRAMTLDRFDGRAWTFRGTVSNVPSIPQPVRAGWTELVSVTVRGLSSPMVITPGPPLDFPRISHRTIGLSSGTFIADGELASGDTYTVRSYVPDPTAAEMRAAPVAQGGLSDYTTVDIPDGTGLMSTVVVPRRGARDDGAAAQLQRSPYARMYRLAQRITAGAPTDYDAVKRIGTWLEGHYGYTETSPVREYPLESFLFTDRAGYCQHFSGAAALMLRMLGIPARVASGFTPGTLDKGTHEYVVRDLDAHSWIEVWFQGIGWVPFDPTPALAPASSQSPTVAPAPSAARGDANDRTPKRRLDALLKTRPDSTTSGGGGAVRAAPGKRPPWGAIALAALGAVLLVSLAVTLIRRRRGQRRPPPAACGDPEVDHLVSLLTRLGLHVEQGMTLLGLEQRLQRLGGPGPAAYAKRLRERRFGGAEPPPPTRAERRQLRKALAAATSAGPLQRLHVALPNAPAVRVPGSKLGRRQAG